MYIKGWYSFHLIKSVWRSRKRETQSYRKIHVSSLTPLLFMYSSALRHWALFLSGTTACLPFIYIYIYIVCPSPAAAYNFKAIKQSVNKTKLFFIDRLGEKAIIKRINLAKVFTQDLLHRRNPTAVRHRWAQRYDSDGADSNVTALTVIALGHQWLWHRCDSDVYFSVTAMATGTAVTAVTTDSAVSAVAADTAVTAIFTLVWQR